MEIQDIQPDARSAGASFDRLFAIVQRLRAPNGCPWDKEQTPLTLRDDLIEEAWECVEAISEGDKAHTAEELGDVFLLATMLSWMHEEEGAFKVQDVLEGISAKLIRRHPHVFGDAQAEDSATVLKQWAEIKEKVEGRPARDSVLDEVKKSLPPLDRALQLQKKAAKSGFDWADLEGLWDKLHEEIGETREAWEELAAARKAMDEPRQAPAPPSGQAPANPATATGIPARPTAPDPGELVIRTQHHLEEELGDLLFMVVNLCRFMKVDPSLALQRCNSKFEFRYRHIETSLKKEGPAAAKAGIERMEELWQEAKALEKAKKIPDKGAFGDMIDSIEIGLFQSDGDPMTYNDLGAGGLNPASTKTGIPSWLQFNDRNLSGNAGLDDAHREMFDLLQKIYLAQFTPESRASTETYLDALEKHLEKHFQQEEQMQRRLAYPEHENHVIEHSVLLVKFREIREQHRNGLCSSGDLFRFMGLHFVKQHLELSDSKFHEWLAAHPAGSK